MKTIVQKFGGTSVETEEKRTLVIDKILQARQEGIQPVVVVSAMGREGAPYATDTLLGLVKSQGPRVANRELDLLLSCGEIVSAVVLASSLRARDIPVRVLTGSQAGIITDSNFGNARILRVNPERVIQWLERDYIVVVAGFQGVTVDGEITTLGRGGSDTTAAAVGVALRSERIEIYTDVNGLMTADPRYVPNARTIHTVTFHEVVQMADLGARVIHPRAVEIAMQANVPLVIRNLNDDTESTQIAHYHERSPRVYRLGKAKLVTGIAHIPNLAQIKILGLKDKNQGLEIFRKLANAQISIDLINVGPEIVAFTIHQDNLEQAAGILEDLGVEFKTERNCTKVSILGTRIRGVPGVMSNVMEALNISGIEVLQTADSHITISCLIRGKDTEKALRALHDRFELGYKGDEPAR